MLDKTVVVRGAALRQSRLAIFQRDVIIAQIIWPFWQSCLVILRSLTLARTHEEEYAET